MNKRGEITTLTVLLVSVALNGVLAIMARGGFHNRSAMSVVYVTGTNACVTITQEVRPSGGADVTIPLKEKQQAAQ